MHQHSTQPSPWPNIEPALLRPRSQTSPSVPSNPSTRPIPPLTELGHDLGRGGLDSLVDVVVRQAEPRVSAHTGHGGVRVVEAVAVFWLAAKMARLMATAEQHTWEATWLVGFVVGVPRKKRRQREREGERKEENERKVTQKSSEPRPALARPYSASQISRVIIFNAVYENSTLTDPDHIGLGPPTRPSLHRLDRDACPNARIVPQNP